MPTPSRPPRRSPPRTLPLILPLMIPALLSGCATTPAPMIPEPFYHATHGRIDNHSLINNARNANNETGKATEEKRGLAIYANPPLPAIKTIAGAKPPTLSAPPAAEGDKLLEATVSLENLPLPQFINTVFAGVLKQNVSVDPQVASRNDMVSLRTGKPQTAAQLSAAAKAVLQSYGLSVSEFNGLVRVVPNNAQSSTLPEIRRGRASPDVPDALRPIFQIVELENIGIGTVAAWLRTLFPGRLNVQEDGGRNTLLLSGQTDTIAAAVDTIQLLDQPMMRGRRSARIVPAYWSADELSRKLGELLTAEGYFVGQNANAASPILLIPIGPINSVIIFAADDKLLKHTLHWARELDQPNKTRTQNGGYVTYFARNVEAAELAKTVSEMLGGVAAPAAPGAAPAIRSSRVVVNAAANSLIIQASAAEFQQLRALLEELDRPARSALVMATVAEVTLDRSETFNFNWVLKQFSKGGYKYDVGTSASGIGRAASNFSVLLSGAAGDPRAVFSALASNNKARVLSNPSVIARSGESATIQVGTQVPIITSQISNANTGSTSGGTGILNTVQYVQTGVILKVKPVVHAGGRIDLDVSQEVSSAATNNTGGTTSPLISNKKVDTKLSVTDGTTVVLGGLISEEGSQGNSGIPWVKDIPVLGGLFQTSNTESSTRRELVILLTSYAMEDDFDAYSVSEAFRKQFAWATPATPATLPRPARANAPVALPPGPAPQKTGPGTPADATLDPEQFEAPVNTSPEAESPPVPDEKNADATQFVAPLQHFPNPPATAAHNALSSPPNVLDSRTVATKAAPPPSGSGKVVTDDKLRAELLQAIQGSPSVPKH